MQGIPRGVLTPDSCPLRRVLRNFPLAVLSLVLAASGVFVDSEKHEILVFRQRVIGTSLKGRKKKEIEEKEKG